MWHQSKHIEPWNHKCIPTSSEWLNTETFQEIERDAQRMGGEETSILPWSIPCKSLSDPQEDCRHSPPALEFPIETLIGSDIDCESIANPL